MAVHRYAIRGRQKTMHSDPDPRDQLRELAEQYGLHVAEGHRLDCVRFEKPGLSIETCNFEDFTVVHGSTQQDCPGLAELAEYLSSL
jgi:hypothetical protein